MKVIRTHRVRIYPNNKQKTLLNKHFGVARLAYNWGIDKWQEMYKAWKEDNSLPKPTSNLVRKKFLSIRRDEFPFMKEVSKTAYTNPFRDLNKAYQSFFRDPKHFGSPKYRNKYVNNSYEIEGYYIKYSGGKYIKLPRIKASIKMAEEVRFLNKKDAQIKNLIISKKNDKFYASFAVEFEKPKRQKTNKEVGIDVGISNLMTLSDGTIYENNQYLRKLERRLKHAQRDLSRTKKGSKNRVKAIQKVANIHEKIANQRKDYIHKITTEISQNYDVVAIETLSVVQMLRNKHLSKSLNDASFGMIFEFLKYKADEIKTVEQFFPSSKTCSACGQVKEKLNLNERIFKCDCGHIMDRDLNAAKNIINYAT